MFKRKVEQAFGRRTANGVLAPKIRVMSLSNMPPMPPIPPKPKPIVPKKRHRTPKHVLDKWVKDLIARDFVPFESLTVERRDAQAAEPQHFEDGTTNEKWKKSRVNKVSGTKASKLTCQHDYTDFDEGLLNCIWDNFAEIMEAKPEVKWKVQWGHDREPQAAQTHLEFLNSKVGKEFMQKFPSTPKSECVKVEHKEYGFVQSIAMPFGGTSPDGVMELTYADGTVNRHEVEFKCKTSGWYRDNWPKDAWPQKTLYPMKHVGGKVYPISTAYYVQIMWCVIIMGKFDLKDIFKLEGHPKHFQAFKKYMEPHLHKAKTQFYGEDMLDVNVPIMFSVFAPGNVKTPHVGEPEIYKRMCFDQDLQTHRSVMAKCPSGCIQITMVEYDHKFAMKTVQYAYYVWERHWLPRLAMKEHGMLLKNELDVPMNCFTDEDTDSEIESPAESEEEEDEDAEEF
jgi:hypothetical protein